MRGSSASSIHYHHFTINTLDSGQQQNIHIDHTPVSCHMLHVDQFCWWDRIQNYTHFSSLMTNCPNPVLLMSVSELMLSRHVPWTRNFIIYHYIIYYYYIKLQTDAVALLDQVLLVCNHLWIAIIAWCKVWICEPRQRLSSRLKFRREPAVIVCILGIQLPIKPVQCLAILSQSQKFGFYTATKTSQG